MQDGVTLNFCYIYLREVEIGISCNLKASHKSESLLEFTVHAGNVS